MEERRNQLRGWTKDSLIVIERDTGEPVGHIVNMSVEGLMVVSEKCADVSRIIECNVLLPGEYHGREQLRFDAEVRWCSESEVDGMMIIGLRITEIDNIGKKIIVKLLENCTVAKADKWDLKATMH